jgi:maltose/moltooligosaccharide transporter
MKLMMPLAASIAGGLIFRASPAAPFFFGAAGMLIAQLILLATVREPEQPERPEEEPPGLLSSLATVLRDRDRSAVLLLGAICCWFLGQSGLDAWFTSFAVQRFGLDLGEAVLLKAFFTLSALGGALPSGALGARIGRRRAILAGLFVFATALAFAYPITSVTLLRPVLVIAGVAWACVVVNSLPLVLDFAPAGREGSYTGLYYLASQTAAFVGPPLSGAVLKLLGNDYRVVCIYAPLGLALAWLLMLGVRRGTSQETAP